ncbi:type II toxin-antitoxin system Phd/YefM family antitoxin [Brucella sp. NBRC 12950]|uniref:type II toxin-antitoxin system Phd/YefM family antitoxin n=1 Tax=Brucella sp. NBRC 12950 TaxID=2994518 RepID=UPI0024A21DD0|nr:type II toxin-antitoxin system Phd/YefM family antitoxin [Brucella sp. NBRC 12950]GLU28254.1 antitoxin [Brucella sp. NBRC 12950]
MLRIEANVAVSVSELKKSPSAVMEMAHGQTVAVLNHNRIMAYMVPAKVYEEMLEKLDDLQLADVVKRRASEKGEPGGLDDI